MRGSSDAQLVEHELRLLHAFLLMSSVDYVKAFCGIEVVREIYFFCTSLTEKVDILRVVAPHVSLRQMSLTET